MYNEHLSGYSELLTYFRRPIVVTTLERSKYTRPRSDACRQETTDDHKHHVHKCQHSPFFKPLSLAACTEGQRAHAVVNINPLHRRGDQCDSTHTKCLNPMIAIVQGYKLIAGCSCLAKSHQEFYCGRGSRYLDDQAILIPPLWKPLNEKCPLRLKSAKFWKCAFEFKPSNLWARTFTEAPRPADHVNYVLLWDLFISIAFWYSLAL